MPELTEEEAMNLRMERDKFLSEAKGLSLEYGMFVIIVDPEGNTNTHVTGLKPWQILGLIDMIKIHSRMMIMGNMVRVPAPQAEENETAH